METTQFSYDGKDYQIPNKDLENLDLEYRFNKTWDELCLEWLARALDNEKITNWKVEEDEEGNEIFIEGSSYPIKIEDAGISKEEQKAFKKELNQLDKDAKEVAKKMAGTDSNSSRDTKRKPPEPDAVKVMILSAFAEYLKGTGDSLGISEVEIVNVQKTIDFHIGKEHYSLNLTKHRPPKKK